MSAKKKKNLYRGDVSFQREIIGLLYRKGNKQRRIILKLSQGAIVWSDSTALAGEVTRPIPWGFFFKNRARLYYVGYIWES